jgi:hypothetical protein
MDWGYGVLRCREYADRLEQSPDQWFREDVYPLTRAVLARVAGLIKCDAGLLWLSLFPRSVLFTLPPPSSFFPITLHARTFVR